MILEDVLFNLADSLLGDSKLGATGESGTGPTTIVFRGGCFLTGRVPEVVFFCFNKLTESIFMAIREYTHQDSLNSYFWSTRTGN